MKTLATSSGIVAVLLTSCVNADTVGYWRFESTPDASGFGPDFLVDSGPNGLDLTNPGDLSPSGNAGQSPNSIRPGFPTTIPQTGASNEYHTFALGGSATEGTLPQELRRADEAAFDIGGDFTIEALVFFGAEPINQGLNADIATQWGGGGDNGFRFLKNATNQLQLGLGNGLGGVAFFNSGFMFENGKDYYVAAAMDFDGENPQATFYFQNLTDGGLLETNTVGTGAGVKPMTLVNSTADFVIGGAAAFNPDSLGGRIDEVRLSSGLLAESELLVTPGDLGLLSDFNGDGIVDLLDLDILGQNFGMSGGMAMGDANEDGTIDLLDLDILGGEFGMGGSNAVPEPASVALLLLACPLASLRRR